MSRLSLACGLILVALAIPWTAATEGGDGTSYNWPTWRGPNRDAVSAETGLLREWGQDGPPLQWEAHGLGEGYSSISIASGRIYTMGRRRGETFLIALDVEDGKELWATPVAGRNPNCTPTVDGNFVYALGRGGELICADAKTGRPAWRKSFREDFGGKMMSHWGYSESPLVDGDRLICTPGAPDAVMAALDKKTGRILWKSGLPEPGQQGKDGAGYSSIVVSEACGVRQYVQLTGRGLISVSAKDGTFLWSYHRIANRTANISTPLIDGDYVFCSTGYGTGAALLHLVPDGAGIKAEEVYFLNAKQMQNHHGGMVRVGEHIYCGHGHNQGFPLCIEMKTGKVAWRGGRGPGRGSAAVLHAEGRLYFRYQDGVMALIETTPDEYRLKGSFTIASNNGKHWPHPVIAGKRLHLRDQDTLLCYNIARN